MSPAELDAGRVTAAAARWVWVPAGATEVVTADYRLTHYTDESMVHWSVTHRSLRELLPEVVGHVRAAGRRTLRWWVDERSVPTDTGEQLAALGLRRDQRLEVLALPVAADVPVVGDVEVRQVTTRADLELAGRIQGEVFGVSPPTVAMLDEQHRLVNLPEAERLVRCYVAYVDGEPAASAGGTVDGDALRLWDGSVLPAHRGRGAYRALVARRLVDARPTTADFALVKAVDNTSAPILRRLGFRPYGERHRWSLPVRG